MAEITMTKLSQMEKVYHFSIIILLFQITRNISTVTYVGILFASYSLLYVIYILIHSKNRNKTEIKFKPRELIFILSLVWIPVISLAHIDMNDFLKAFPRYFITFPFILFAIIYKSYSYGFIQKVLRTLCIFMALASLSIPYQIVFGPINFFADSSFREGVVRYSSLAGSLTALGTLGAFSLAILLFTDSFIFKKKTKNLLIILIVLGMLMSLQKAALVNILLCFSAYIFFKGNVSLIKRIITIISLCLLTFGIYFITKETQLGLYIESLILYSFSGGTLGIEQDLMSRIWERPNSVIQYNNIGVIDFLLGIGFPSLAGIMGLRHFPMAHNNYFDLIFSGGILHFVSFLFLMIRIPLSAIFKKVKGSRVNIIDRSYSIIILLLLVNMVIGAGSFYQPITAVFVFFILFSYDRANYLIENKI